VSVLDFVKDGMVDSVLGKNFVALGFGPFRHIQLFDRSYQARLKSGLIVCRTSRYDEPTADSVQRVAERVEMTRAGFASRPGVEVDTFEGLLVDYARKRRADVIVRGLRAISDFEFEMQMALMNRRLSSTIETVLMMPAESYTYLSSRLVKEVFALGGSIRGLVPDLVEARLAEKARITDSLVV